MGNFRRMFIVSEFHPWIYRERYVHFILETRVRCGLSRHRRRRRRSRRRKRRRRRRV